MYGPLLAIFSLGVSKALTLPSLSRKERDSQGMHAPFSWREKGWG